VSYNPFQTLLQCFSNDTNVVHHSLRSAYNTKNTKGTPKWYMGLVSYLVYDQSGHNVGCGTPSIEDTSYP
jgi:hypothetical protein